MVTARFKVGYCDPVASRRMQVLTDLLADRCDVRLADDLNTMPEGVDVVLVGVQDLRDTLPRLAALAQRGDCQLMLLWEGDDTQALIEAMRMGVRDIVQQPAGITEAIARERARRTLLQTGSGARPGKIVTIFSLKGGIGKSTIAANLAIALHHLLQTPATLIDLSLPLGNQDMYLDLQPPRCVGDVLATGSDLDEAVLVRALMTHASGVSLLAGPRPETMHVLGDHSMWPILDILTRQPGVTVVDLGAYMEEAHASVLDASDLILMPVVPVIASLGSAPKALHFLASVGVPDTRVWPVMNHTLPATDSLPDTLLTQLLGRLPQWDIPHGGVLIQQGWNQGMPTVLAHPRHAWSQAVAQMAQAVAAQLGLRDIPKPEAVIRKATVPFWQAWRNWKEA